MVTSVAATLKPKSFVVELTPERLTGCTPAVVSCVVWNELARKVPVTSTATM